MGLFRLLSALIMLGAAAWIGALVHDANTASIAGAQTGSYPVAVVGPEGQIFNGTVAVENATALRVLMAAGEEGGFDVVVGQYPNGAFVESIAGHENEGQGGWCYAVWEGRWIRPAHSAGAHAMEAGQASRWSYGSDGCGTLG